MTAYKLEIIIMSPDSIQLVKIVENLVKWYLDKPYIVGMGCSIHHPKKEENPHE